MRNYLKSGLVLALGVAGIILTERNIENIQLKSALELPIAITALGGAYFLAKREHQTDPSPVYHHQLDMQFRGKTGRENRDNSGIVYRNHREFNLRRNPSKTN